MAITSAICTLLTLQSKPVNWNPKVLQFPSEMTRVRFTAYVLPDKSPFKVQKALLVWVPKLDEFPGRPGRQALRLSLKDSEGRQLEIFEVPSIKEDGRTNMGQVIGQGYLSLPMKIGMSIVYVERNGTCIGLVSKELNTHQMYDLAEYLQPWKPNRTGK